MSRLGKKPIEIPEKTEVTVAPNSVTVKGPLGELSMPYKSVIDIKVADEVVTLSPKRNDLATNALWGTYSSLVRGMIEGVNKEFEKKLVVEGVGFRAEVKGKAVVLQVGFSHPVELTIPDGLKVTVENGAITVSGSSKQAVGQFAAEIRSTKKPEPYKGKGIRYENEIIRRKEGKKVV